jgi:hypothetical protein
LIKEKCGGACPPWNIAQVNVYKFSCAVSKVKMVKEEIELLDTLCFVRIAPCRFSSFHRSMYDTSSHLIIVIQFK